MDASALRSLSAMFVAALAGAPSAFAQPWVTYDASLGTLPPGQCYVEHLDVDPAPPPAFTLEVVGNDLHVSTLNWQADGTHGGGLWWDRTDVPIHFASGAALECRLRIVTAPDRRVNTAGNPRPGFALDLQEQAGRTYWVGFGSGRLFLSNTFFGQYDTANTLDMAFDTTAAHHVYRIEATGAGAVLLIDGVQRLGPIGPGPASFPTPNGIAYFGDPTYWTNSEVYVSWFRVSGTPTGSFGGLTPPQTVRVCPVDDTAHFEVEASGIGPFEYQWQAEAPPGSGVWEDLVDGPSKVYGTIAGATTEALDLSGFSPGAQTRYRVVVTSECGDVASAPASLLICLADFTCDGITNSTDVGEFINQWFTDQVEGTLVTDIDLNGIVNSTDVGEFINLWFADIANGCG